MIPVNEPLLDGRELQYVSDCVTSGWISSAGKYISDFEKEFVRQIDSSGHDSPSRRRHRVSRFVTAWG